jgi:uncharacterized protein with HEPN domain
MVAKKSKTPEFYLGHILQAAGDIAEHISGYDKKLFCDEKKTHDAVIRQLMIIGEAAKNLPMDFRKKHSAVPWKTIAGMRDILVHEYFGVDLALAWKMAKDDVPDLKEKILKISRSNKQRKLI